MPLEILIILRPLIFITINKFKKNSNKDLNKGQTIQ